MRLRVRPLLPVLLPLLSRDLDQWAEWLVRARWEGWSDEQSARGRAWLEEVRDRVLDGASIREGDTVLDVGSGIGLLAVGALQRLGPDGEVVAIDVSADCIDELLRGLRDGRLSLRLGSADALPLLDASVDVVVTRSVLIFVPEKGEAAREFFRVLRAGGRFSIFEPINRRNRRLSELVDFGELAGRFAAWEEARSSNPDDPMLNFDEHDLQRHFAEAGFADVEATLEEGGEAWPGGQLLDVVGAPGRPTLRRQLEEAFSADELEMLVGALEAQQLDVHYPHLFLTGTKPA